MEFKDLLESVLAADEGVPNLKIHSLKESPCTQPGQNFMSVVSLVYVEGELPNGASYSRSVFVKRPPPPGDHYQAFNLDAAFNNEVLMYRAVLPLITGAADVTRVACPRHYHAANDVIVLEDLVAQGYGSGEPARGFDLDTARSVIKALAKFHAASYHTSVVERDNFGETIKGLDPLGLTVSGNRGLVEASLKRAITYLDAQSGLQNGASFLRTLQGRVTETMRKLREPHRVAVLVHGDFWFNNILTQDRIKSSSVTEEDRVRIIDLQACAFLSPAVDLWLFLYTSISTSLLSDHCDTLIQLYYSTFVETLNIRNTPADSVPTEESIKEEFSSKELYGFLVAMTYLPALYLKREIVKEMSKASEEERKGEGFLERYVSPEFRERIVELARYCVKKGIL